MSDENVEVSFGATAEPMAPGVNAAKAQVNSFAASTKAMGAGFQGVVGGMVDSLLVLGGAASGSFREIRTGAQEAGEAVKGTAESVTEFREAISGIGEALIAAFAVEQLAEFAEKMGEVAESTYHAAVSFGLTTQEIQQMKALAATVDAPFDAITSAMTRLDRSFANAKAGATGPANALKEIGISASESLTQTELFNRAIEGLGNMAAGPAKVAVATQLFGRNIQAIGPILAMSKEQLEEFNTSLDSYGIKNDDAEKKGLALADAFDNQKVASQGLNNVMTSALAPTLTVIVQGFNSLAASFIASYQQGGAAKVTMDAIAVTLKVVTAAVITLAEGFLDLWHIAAGAVEAILAPILGLGSALNALVQHDFANVGAAYEATTRGMEASAKGHFAAAADSARGYAADMQKLFGPGAKLPDLPAPGKGTTGDDPTKVAKTKGPSEIEQWKADLAEMLAADENFGADDAKLTLDFWTSKLALVQAGSKAEVAVRTEVAKAKRAVALEEQRDELAVIKNTTAMKAEAQKSDYDIAKTGFDAEKDLIDQRLALGLITDQQAVQQRNDVNAKLRQLDLDEAEAEYQIQLAALQQEAAVLGLKPEQRAEINRQIEALEQAHQDKMAQIAATNARGATADNSAKDLATFAQDKSWVDPAVSAWVSGMQSMEKATGSFKDMALGVFDSIANTAIAKVGQMVENWIISHVLMRTTATAAAAADVATTTTAQAAKTAVVVGGEAVRTGAVATATATTSGLTLTSALAQIAAHAAVAAAGAYAALASIPFVGPVIAPVAAAAALVGVLALGKSLFSAAGGWGEVPQDGMITQLHKKEMVLPASIAEPLRQSLAGGFGLPGGGSSLSGAAAAGSAFRGSLAGGNVHQTYAPNITNPTADLGQLLADQGREMRKWMKNEVRNNPGLWGAKPS